MTNSADLDQKPAYLGLHCLQRQDIPWIYRIRVKDDVSLCFEFTPSNLVLCTQRLTACIDDDEGYEDVFTVGEEVLKEVKPIPSGTCHLSMSHPLRCIEVVSACPLGLTERKQTSRKHSYIFFTPLNPTFI